MQNKFRSIARFALLLVSLGVSAQSFAQEAADAAGTVSTITIYRHAAWGDHPPKGVDADGVRQNLAPTDLEHNSVTFHDLTLKLTKSESAEAGVNDDGTPKSVDQATLSLTKGEKTETRTANEGDAFNWEGYHIAVVAMYRTPGELGFGSTVIEVATIASLPESVAQSTKAGGAENRLRVKHTVDKLTLHHSATSHTAGDDLGKKLRNMQSWGETDRNWWDIPYHFIIDIDGTVCEARDYHYVGDTNTRYDPAGHFLINCFGNYSQQEPNEEQLATIANLMAWAAMEYKIDPLVIYGHGDLAQTSCPGKNLDKHLKDGSLQKMVEDAMKKGKPQIVWLDKIEPPAATPAP